MLKIERLCVNYQKRSIVNGVTLVLKRGEIIVLMGPNGSGKSTLANALLGHPSYTVTSGKIILDGRDITNRKPEERVQQGLFLAWQNPIAVPGISLTKLVRELSQGQLNLTSLRSAARNLHLAESLLIRSLNDGFSGGEKKKTEMLQAQLLAKKYVVFDEIDTGLDVDALKKIATQINLLKNKRLGSLVITHYHRLVKLLDLDRVLVMNNGVISQTGTRTLAATIENHGYGAI